MAFDFDAIFKNALNAGVAAGVALYLAGLIG